MLSRLGKILDARVSSAFVLAITQHPRSDSSAAHHVSRIKRMIFASAIMSPLTFANHGGLTCVTAISQDNSSVREMNMRKDASALQNFNLFYTYNIV